LFEIQSFYGSKFRISEKHPLLVHRKKPKWIIVESITKKDKVNKWLETNNYIASIFDGHEKLMISPSEKKELSFIQSGIKSLSALYKIN